MTLLGDNFVRRIIIQYGIRFQSYVTNNNMLFYNILNIIFCDVK